MAFKLLALSRKHTSFILNEAARATRVEGSCSKSKGSLNLEQFEASYYHSKYYQHVRIHLISSIWYSANILSNCREVLLGITGKDFTLVAASKAAMRGATILKASDDKTRALNQHTLMAFSGEAGDTSKSRCSFAVIYDTDITTTQFNSQNIFKPTLNFTLCAITLISPHPLSPTLFEVN